MKESMSERITVRLDGETALNIDIMNKLLILQKPR